VVVVVVAVLVVVVVVVVVVVLRILMLLLSNVGGSSSLLRCGCTVEQPIDCGAKRGIVEGFRILSSESFLRRIRFNHQLWSTRLTESPLRN